MNAGLSEMVELEKLMFRQLEIKELRAKLLLEKQTNDYKIEKILRDSNTNQHIAKFDDNFELKATIKEDRQKVFEKDKMADDLKVTPSSTQKKDFLINMTEQGKLTLAIFKRYFHYEPTTKLSVRKVKISKPKNKRK